MIKAIKNWYVELVEIIPGLIKTLLLNLPQLACCFALLCIWFFMLAYLGRKFGGIGVAAGFILPIIPAIAFIIISDKILKQKANAVDPSEFIGKVYLDDPDKKAWIKLTPRYDSEGNRSYALGYSTATVLSTKSEYDRKGNRVYTVEFVLISDGTKQHTHSKELPALEVYRHTKISKIWIPNTIQEYISSRKII